MGFQGLLTDEEKLVRETARKFVNEEVLPIIEEHARRRLRDNDALRLVPELVGRWFRQWERG